MATIGIFFGILGMLLSIMTIMINLDDSPGWVCVGILMLALNGFVIYANVQKNFGPTPPQVIIITQGQCSVVTQ